MSLILLLLMAIPVEHNRIAALQNEYIRLSLCGCNEPALEIAAKALNDAAIEGAMRAVPPIPVRAGYPSRDLPPKATT